MPSLVPLHGCHGVYANVMPSFLPRKMPALAGARRPVEPKKKIGPPGLFREADQLQGVGV